MTGPASASADPSMIGGVAKAPFVLLPDPCRAFAQRAVRFDVLAEGNELAPYLRFLGRLTRVQADLAAASPPPEPLPAGRIDFAASHGMPPLDRPTLLGHEDVAATLDRLFDAAAGIAMPQAAGAALDAVRRTPALAPMIDNVLASAIPADALAEHVFVAAGTQLVAARLAAALDAARLTPVGTGLCPACGGQPVASLVIGGQGAEGARYAACSLCGTFWNEVRIKCLACGSTKGIGYRAVENDGEDATVKAEVCDVCRSWVKILYQNKNPSLDPVADDVASLGLDLLLREAGYGHAGFNPFMLGY